MVGAALGSGGGSRGMRGGDLREVEDTAGLRQAGADDACSAVTVGRPLHVVSGTRPQRSRLAAAGMAFFVPTVSMVFSALRGFSFRRWGHRRYRFLLL